MTAAHRRGTSWTAVVPTVGRPTLPALVAALLDAGSAQPPAAVIVVDDRVHSVEPLPVPAGATVIRSGGRGPAAARNAGWRQAGSEWVVFVDDDVVVGPGWHAALGDDLDRACSDTAGVQGRITVPLPPDRPPTDWERNTAGLESACWATADMAYRRVVLQEVGGFDERFPRAFREDADLGLRVTAAGYLIVAGERGVTHPVRPAGPGVSVRAQAGNADDIMMAVLHGPGWRQRCGAEPGRNGRHLATVAAGVAAIAAAVLGNRRAAGVAAAAWAAGTAELAAARIAPGPRHAGEVMTMLATSAAIPPAAVAHMARGLAGRKATLADTRRAPLGQGRSPLVPSRAMVVRPARADPLWRPGAILFDRDGTLVLDVPANGDPARVALMPGARQAVRRARLAGLRVGVVTNQPAVGAGQLHSEDLDRVNARVDELAGPFDAWAICPHEPADDCACRKPQAGLVLEAAARLGVAPDRCAVIGDIGSDVEAALAAGARPVMVPTRVTRRSEIAAAPAVAPDLLRAVDFVLAGTC